MGSGDILRFGKSRGRRGFQLWGQGLEKDGWRGVSEKRWDSLGWRVEREVWELVVVMYLFFVFRGKVFFYFQIYSQMKVFWGMVCRARIFQFILVVRQSCSRILGVGEWVMLSGGIWKFYGRGRRGVRRGEGGVLFDVVLYYAVFVVFLVGVCLVIFKNQRRFDFVKFLEQSFVLGLRRGGQ